MTLQEWLRAAQADAERRGLDDLNPLLETLSHATAALREAAFEHEPCQTSPTSPSGTLPGSWPPVKSDRPT